MKGHKKIAEGKTKIIWQEPDQDDEVLFEGKDDITAGDGAKHDMLEGKAAFNTEITCNCFQVLNEAGVQTHFIERVNEKTFRALKMKMIPIEIVARRFATGSYLMRETEIEEGTCFDPLVVELYFKDDARHDPIMIWNADKKVFELYEAKKPVSEQTFLGVMSEKKLVNMQQARLLKQFMRDTFRVLEKAWSAQNVDLVDMKIECGFTAAGRLLVGDVIDNDSWRIWPEGKKEEMKDKQVYRDLEKTTKHALAALSKNYAWVAEATGKFLE